MRYSATAIAATKPSPRQRRHLYVSPGVSVALGTRVQTMLFLQLPLYQYVNGVQLTADDAVTCGVGVRF